MTATATNTTWRTTAFALLTGHDRHARGSNGVMLFIIALIIINGIAVILEANPAIYIPNAPLFTILELFSVAVFTLEYCCRVWIATEDPRWAGQPAWMARLKYMLTPMALVDLLAIAPFYLSMLIPVDLRYLRLFRLLRLLKLSHYFDGLRIFSVVLQRESSAIAGALLIMLTLIIVSACLMFTVENAAHPGRFESVAEAIWWAVVTLTTVGYGDITPITFAGRLLAIVIMILGVGTMALPAGIMAARFSEELQNRREILRSRVMDAMQDGNLDLSEKHELELLKRQLGFSAEELQHIVEMQKASHSRYKYCPHCGESLND
ncbi:MAG: potassium channel family protein [Gammaproteobacteria bacterium]|nr:potassium channel family protein [Gammaproteobacteria bacterium]